MAGNVPIGDGLLGGQDRRLQYQDLARQQGRRAALLRD
jgi:hypothetical protein